MSNLKNELPSNIRVATTSRRAGAFVLDTIMGIAFGVAVYFALGNPVLLKAAGYDENVGVYTDLAVDTGIAYKDKDGNAMQYTFQAKEQTTWKETYNIDIPDNSYSYLAYETISWNYYFKMLGQTDGVDHKVHFVEGEFSSTKDKGSEEYRQELGKWIYINVFDFEEGKTSTGYFQLVNNDYSLMPSISEAYQNKLSSSDKETVDNALGDLHDVFDNSTSSTKYGIYQKAIINFNGQEAIVNATAQIQTARSLSLLPSFAGAPLIFFVILPLILKGQTLGKKILGLGLVSEDGYRASSLQSLIHHGVLGVIFSLLCVPYYQLIFPLVLGLFVIDFVIASVSKNGRSLHDRLSRTIVVDLKNSTVFANEEEENAYVRDNPDSRLAKTKAAEDAEARAKEYSEPEILDLSTINRNREEARNIVSFDEFEKQHGLDQVALGETEAPAMEEAIEPEVVENPEEEKKEKEDEAPLNEDGFTDEQ